MLTDKRSINTVVIALRRDSGKVQMNSTWLRLHRDYCIGVRLGSTALRLTEEDHRTLRAMLMRDMTFDPLLHGLEVFEGDRLDLAGRVRNEKLGRATVADQIVMVASLSGELPLASGTYKHPVGGTMSVPAAELHGLKRVLLVENLHVMFALQRYRWPEEVRDLPMLFRGSPQITPAAVTIALSRIEQVVSFPDFDPQGWMNTLTTDSCAIVLPSAETIESIVKTRLDKPADFAEQSSARIWLSNCLLEPVRMMLRRELAISQESMAGMSLEMADLPRLPGTDNTEANTLSL